jgi:hypothetical protein
LLLRDNQWLGKRGHDLWHRHGNGFLLRDGLGYYRLLCGLFWLCGLLGRRRGGWSVILTDETETLSHGITHEAELGCARLSRGAAAGHRRDHLVFLKERFSTRLGGTGRKDRGLGRIRSGRTTPPTTIIIPLLQCSEGKRHFFLFTKKIIFLIGISLLLGLKKK